MFSASIRPCAASRPCRLPQLGASSGSRMAAHITPLSAPQRSQRGRARAAAPAKEAKESAKAPVGFKNVQRFLVPEGAQAPFEAAWKERASHMETMDGFVSFNITQSGDKFSVESVWGSIPDWEKFNLSPEARRQHLPSGIWQFVPKAGEGFPEDFVPFFEMNEQVNAKYPKKR